MAVEAVAPAAGAERCETTRRGEANASGEAPNVTLLPRSMVPSLVPPGDGGGGICLVLPGEARADSEGGATKSGLGFTRRAGSVSAGGACHGSGTLLHPEGLRIGDRGPRFFEGVGSPMVLGRREPVMTSEF